MPPRKTRAQAAAQRLTQPEQASPLQVMDKDPTRKTRQPRKTQTPAAASTEQSAASSKSTGKIQKKTAAPKKPAASTKRTTRSKARSQSPIEEDEHENDEDIDIQEDSAQHGLASASPVTEPQQAPELADNINDNNGEAPQDSDLSEQEQHKVAQVAHTLPADVAEHPSALDPNSPSLNVFYDTVQGRTGTPGVQSSSSSDVFYSPTAGRDANSATADGFVVQDDEHVDLARADDLMVLEHDDMQDEDAVMNDQELDIHGEDHFQDNSDIVYPDMQGFTGQDTATPGTQEDVPIVISDDEEDGPLDNEVAAVPGFPSQDWQGHDQGLPQDQSDTGMIGNDQFPFDDQLNPVAGPDTAFFGTQSAGASHAEAQPSVNDNQGTNQIELSSDDEHSTPEFSPSHHPLHNEAAFLATQHAGAAPAQSSFFHAAGQTNAFPPRKASSSSGSSSSPEPDRRLPNSMYVPMVIDDDNDEPELPDTAPASPIMDQELPDTAPASPLSDRPAVAASTPERIDREPPATPQRPAATYNNPIILSDDSSHSSPVNEPRHTGPAAHDREASSLIDHTAIKVESPATEAGHEREESPLSDQATIKLESPVNEEPIGTPIGGIVYDEPRLPRSRSTTWSSEGTQSPLPRVPPRRPYHPPPPPSTRPQRRRPPLAPWPTGGMFDPMPPEPPRLTRGARVPGVVPLRFLSSSLAQGTNTALPQDKPRAAPTTLRPQSQAPRKAPQSSFNGREIVRSFSDVAGTLLRQRPNASRVQVSFLPYRRDAEEVPWYPLHADLSVEELRVLSECYKKIVQQREPERNADQPGSKRKRTTRQANADEEDEEEPPAKRASPVKLLENRSRGAFFNKHGNIQIDPPDEEYEEQQRMLKAQEQAEQALEQYDEDQEAPAQEPTEHEEVDEDEQQELQETEVAAEATPAKEAAEPTANSSWGARISFGIGSLFRSPFKVFGNNRKPIPEFTEPQADAQDPASPSQVAASNKAAKPKASTAAKKSPAKSPRKKTPKVKRQAAINHNEMLQRREAATEAILQSANQAELEAEIQRRVEEELALKKTKKTPAKKRKRMTTTTDDGSPGSTPHPAKTTGKRAYVEAVEDEGDQPANNPVTPTRAGSVGFGLTFEESDEDMAAPPNKRVKTVSFTPAIQSLTTPPQGTDIARIQERRPPNTKWTVGSMFRDGPVKSALKDTGYNPEQGYASPRYDLGLDRLDPEVSETDLPHQVRNRIPDEDFNFSGSFSMPVGSDSEEDNFSDFGDDDDTAGNTPMAKKTVDFLGTEQGLPPAAPQPAHATLPTSHPDNSKSEADALTAARTRAHQFTPKQPSRLRETKNVTPPPADVVEGIPAISEALHGLDPAVLAELEKHQFAAGRENVDPAVLASFEKSELAGSKPLESLQGFDPEVLRAVDNTFDGFWQSVGNNVAGDVRSGFDQWQDHTPGLGF